MFLIHNTANTRSESHVTTHDVTPFLFLQKTKIRINTLKRAYDIQAFHEELNE